MTDRKLKSCIDQAERFLTLREHNEKELKDKLKNKGHEAETINEAISFLKDENELSEERYIRSFIRSNNSRHPEGLRVMLQRLSQKGSERTLSNEIAQEIYTEEYTEKLAWELFDKLSRKTSDIQKIKQKMLVAGFSLSLVNRVANNK